MCIRDRYLAIIRQIRDNDKDLFEKIKRLPKKAKTGRNSTLVKNNSTISFIKKGYIKSFFLSDGNVSEQISFMDAVSYMKCEPDEEKVSVGKSFFDHYDKNNEAFDFSLIEDEVVTTAKPAAAGNDQKIIKTLKAFLHVKGFTDDQEEKIRKMIEIWENGDVPAADSKNILKEIKNVEDAVEAYYKIVGMLDEKYFAGRQTAVSNADGEKQVILSCYLKESK